MPVALVPAPARRGRLTKLSDVHARAITWLVPGRVPNGALSVIAGRPGEGKSTLTIAFGAALTRAGTPFIVVGAEDGLADTVKPRVIAAGGDPSLAYGFDVEVPGGDDIPMLPEDVPFLERAVKDSGAALVIIDPVQAHLSGDVSTNNDHSVRQALRPLAKMAQTTGAAVVLVSHFRKSREGSPLDWIGGSGVQGSVRSALLFGRGKGDDPLTAGHLRYLVHVKSNGSELAPGMVWALDGAAIEEGGRTIRTSKVTYMEEEIHEMKGDKGGGMLA